MEKIIEIELKKKEDILDTYKSNIINKNLIEHLISETNIKDKNITIKIKTKLKYDFTNMIKEGIKKEYNKSIKEKNKNNKIQITLLTIGIIFLMLSLKTKSGFIWNEVFSIIGWVAMWELLDIEIFTDREERIKRKKLKALYKSIIKIDN